MSYSLEGRMIREIARTALWLYNIERLKQQVQSKAGVVFEDVERRNSVWYGYVRGIGWKPFTYYLNL